jgi:glucose-6-phosphate isomerase
MKPAVASVWTQLGAAAEGLRGRHLRDMFAADADRFASHTVTWNDWLLDYSKQRVDANAMALLCALWQAAYLPGWIARMRGGEAINHTEGRAVLHTALRHPAGIGAGFPCRQ